MVMRFVLAWWGLSILIGSFIYFLTAEEKRSTLNVVKKVLLSMAVGIIVMVGLMFFNNISGV